MAQLKQLLIALDQAANCLLFWWAPGGCWADETLSCRSYRMRAVQPFMFMRPLIDLVARVFGDRDHCFNSFINERLRTQLPPSLRDKKRTS